MANGFASNGTSTACPFGKCDGGGWILGDDDLAHECDCRAPRLAKAKASGINSVIPRRYRGVSFDRPPVTEIDRDAVNAVRDWIDSTEKNLEEGHGLWLMGSTGTGKTTLAMLVSSETLKRGHSVAIYSLPKLLARIRSTFDAQVGEESYAEFFERLCDVDLLHIDDLGAEKRSDWVLEQLYAIVDERYQSQRSVVVTTNLPLHELEEQVGPRTVSRLVEICGDPLPLNGEDLRFHVRPA